MLHAHGHAEAVVGIPRAARFPAEVAYLAQAVMHMHVWVHW